MQQIAWPLYSRVGTTNVLEKTAHLADPLSWAAGPQVVMTNLWAKLPAPVVLPRPFCRAPTVSPQ